jgi:pimeloyl-ACP methyl ester carboxylesterase
MGEPKLEHFRTPSLSIGCEVSGPPDGAPTILLHGWPDDARTWDRVLPALHAAGRRTIVPYLRGCGPTRFASAHIRRNGQLVALGQDVLDLADAMELRTFAVVGHDWGARAAYIASALAPARVTHCVSLSVGWGVESALADLRGGVRGDRWVLRQSRLVRRRAALLSRPLGIRGDGPRALSAGDAARAGIEDSRSDAGHPRGWGSVQRPRHFRGQGALLRVAIRARRPRAGRPFSSTRGTRSGGCGHLAFPRNLTGYCRRVKIDS